jgi:hypothetical protein
MLKKFFFRPEMVKLFFLDTFLKFFCAGTMLEMKFLFSSGRYPKTIFLKPNFVKLSVAGSYDNFSKNLT